MCDFSVLLILLILVNAVIQLNMVTMVKLLILAIPVNLMVLWFC